MRQFGSELAKLQKIFVEQINQIGYHHLIALLYIVVGLSIVLSPTQAAMGWLLSVSGISGEILSFLFIGCSIIIANNPPKRIFIVCLFPLIIYLLVFSFYAISTNYPALEVGFCYIGGLIALVWTLQFHSLGKLKLSQVLSFIMALIGIGIFNSPDLGVVGWIFRTYSTSGQVLSLALIVSAFWMAVNPKHTLFWAQTSVFSVYIGSSIMFNARSVSGDLVGVSVAVMFAVSLLWAYRHLDKYYEVR